MGTFRTNGKLRARGDRLTIAYLSLLPTYRVQCYGEETGWYLHTPTSMKSGSRVEHRFPQSSHKVPARRSYKNWSGEKPSKLVLDLGQLRVLCVLSHPACQSAWIKMCSSHWCAVIRNALCLLLLKLHTCTLYCAGSMDSIWLPRLATSFTHKSQRNSHPLQMHCL